MSPGTGIAGIASFSGVEAWCMIAIVVWVLLVVVVMATDCVVVVVAVVGAVCERLLVVVVAGVRAAIETEGCAASGVLGSTAALLESASPWFSSTGLDSMGNSKGSIEETSDSWLIVAWASTGVWTSSSLLSCSTLAGLIGREVSPWGWLTVVWACGVGSLDGPEELSRAGSGGSGGLGVHPL